MRDLATAIYLQVGFERWHRAFFAGKRATPALRSAFLSGALHAQLYEGPRSPDLIKEALS